MRRDLAEPSDHFATESDASPKMVLVRLMLALRSWAAAMESLAKSMIFLAAKAAPMASPTFKMLDLKLLPAPVASSMPFLNSLLSARKRTRIDGPGTDLALPHWVLEAGQWRRRRWARRISRAWSSM